MRDTMKRPSSTDDRMAALAELEQQAWAWLRLLASGKATDDDADRFRHWLRAGPMHKMAYSKVKLNWDAITSSAQAWRHTDPKLAALQAGKRYPPLVQRRMFLGAAVGAVAAAGAAVAYPPLGLWPTPSEWGADYRTATGEQTTIALTDGIEVTLNTQTSIRRQVDGGRTVGVELVNGEAAINLAQAVRPFAVVAGVGSSAAQSGQFQVRYLDGKVCVTCIDGAVRVEHPAGVRALKASQQTIYDAHTISGTAGIDPAQVTAWRGGVLVLNEARLADAIEEINRYRVGRVILLNDAMRDKRVSGSFPIASLDQTLWQMQHAFGLQARALVGGVLLLS
jgi:transmembrane sensor